MSRRKRTCEMTNLLHVTIEDGVVKEVAREVVCTGPSKLQIGLGPDAVVLDVTEWRMEQPVPHAKRFITS